MNNACTQLRHTISGLSSRNNISALPQPEHHHRTSGSGFTCRFSCLISVFSTETRVTIFLDFLLFILLFPNLRNYYKINLYYSTFNS
mgnify:CR=1 FL=1